MSMFPSFGQIAGALDIAALPTLRGRQYSAAGGFLSAARLATDPIGTATVTFSGVVANSEIRVYDSTGTELAGIEDCGANQVLAWSVYSPGNPNNDVTIRIVKLDKKIKDFPYTSAIGAQAIPIQQEPDPWYSNPA